MNRNIVSILILDKQTKNQCKQRNKQNVNNPRVSGVLTRFFYSTERVVRYLFNLH